MASQWRSRFAAGADRPLSCCTGNGQRLPAERWLIHAGPVSNREPFQQGEHDWISPIGAGLGPPDNAGPRIWLRGSTRKDGFQSHAERYLRPKQCVSPSAFLVTRVDPTFWPEGGWRASESQGMAVRERIAMPKMRVSVFLLLSSAFIASAGYHIGPALVGFLAVVYVINATWRAKDPRRQPSVGVPNLNAPESEPHSRAIQGPGQGPGVPRFE